MPEKSLILRIKSDGADARADIAKTKKEIDKLFEGSGAAGKAASAVAGGMSALEIGLQKSMPYLEGMLDVARQGIELAQFAEERQRTMSLVGDSAMAALREGTRGLVDDTTLAQIAVKGLQGDFKLSTQQMQSVGEAAVALSQKGFGSIQNVLADLTNALRQGEVEGLKKYGIVLDNIPGKADRVRAGLVEVEAIARASAHEIADAGTSLQRAVVGMKNTTDDIKATLGEAAGATGGFIVEQTQYFGEFAAAVYVAGTEFRSTVRSMGEELRWFRQVADEELGKAQKRIEAANTDMGKLLAGGDEIQRRRLQESARLDDEGAERRKKREEAAKKKSDDKAANDERDYRRRLADMDNANREIEEARERRENEWSAAQEKRWRIIRDAQAQAHRELTEYMAREARQFIPLEDRIGMVGQVADDPLAKLLGRKSRETPADPYAHLRNGAAAYRKSIDDLRDSVRSLADVAGTAFGALIMGQEGAGRAALDSARMWLQGETVRAAGAAFESLGLAAYNFAWGNIPGALKALEAAGIFAAFAAGGGIASAAMGPTEAQRGSASGGGTGSGSTSAPREVGSGGTTNSTTIVVKIGSGFVGDERRLARELGRVFGQGLLRGDIRLPTVVRRVA